MDTSLITRKRQQQGFARSGWPSWPSALLSSALLLSSLEFSDTKSVSLKYETASEPLHISAKKMFLYRDPQKTGIRTQWLALLALYSVMVGVIPKRARHAP
jgi:hypothetical protein